MLNLQQLPACHQVQDCQGCQSYPTGQRSEVQSQACTVNKSCCWQYVCDRQLAGNLTLAPGKPASPVRPGSPVAPLGPTTPGPPRSPVAPYDGRKGEGRRLVKWKLNIGIWKEISAVWMCVILTLGPAGPSEPGKPRPPGAPCRDNQTHLALWTKVNTPYLERDSLYHELNTLMPKL